MGMESHLLGIKAEKMACKYVQRLGYRIVCQNWRCPYGEIDIVAEKEGKIKFFEVKYRSGNSYGYVHESLNYSKISKLRKAINLFLVQTRNYESTWSLEGLCIFSDNNGYKLRYYPDMLNNS